MALKGNQKKLDKNKNNRIDAQDFKILKAEKAKGRGMGLQDEKVKPGKVMKAKKGSGLDLPVIKSVKPQPKKNTTKTNPNKPRFSSMEEMRRAKGFKPGESVASFNKRRMELARAKDAAKALGPRGKIALGVAAAGVGAIQYLKSKMKKKKEMKGDVKGSTAPYKKMGGGMMKKPMGYDRGGMYLTDEKIKKVFPEKDAKRRANISQLVGGDRVSPMKKERFTAGQSARRRDLLKKIGKQVAKATPLGLGIKAGEVAKKIKDKIKKRSEGGPAATPGRPISKVAQRRGMGARKKNLEERVHKAGVSNIFSNFRQGAKKAEKKYASIPSGMKKDRDTDTKIKLNLLKSSRKDPFKEMDDTRREVFATERMGGGMMKRPMGYKAGMSIKGDDKREIRKTESMIGASKSSPREKARKKMMGGGMMQRPMGYRSGKSVKVKCKLGRNKPTKMY